MGKRTRPPTVRFGASASGVNQVPATINDPRIRDAVRDLEQNLLPLASVAAIRERLSRKANLSAGGFGVLFKRETGLALASHIRILRLKRTAKLLETTPLRVKEIANAVGYTATSNFDRDFADAFGASPREYRRRRGNEKR